MKPKDKSSKNKGAKKPDKDKPPKAPKQLSPKRGKPPDILASKGSQPQDATIATQATTLLDTSQTTASGIQTKRKATIEEWFDSVRTHMARTADSGAPTGACLVPDANGGPSLCIEMTQESCGSPAVKGQWLGGDC
jgi:hypothetical protein